MSPSFIGTPMKPLTMLGPLTLRAWTGNAQFILPACRASFVSKLQNLPPLGVVERGLCTSQRDSYYCGYGLTRSRILEIDSTF